MEDIGVSMLVWMFEDFWGDSGYTAQQMLANGQRRLGFIAFTDKEIDHGIVWHI